jgi:hypothetical protein
MPVPLQTPGHSSRQPIKACQKRKSWKLVFSNGGYSLASLVILVVYQVPGGGREDQFQANSLILDGQNKITLKKIFTKYSVLTGVIVSVALMVIAISLYPGGSMVDNSYVGFSLRNNFISNLFEPVALNGTENASRIWACLGMILLPCTYAIFFIHMSKKIPDRNAGHILTYMGIANILFTFLIATPWHDLMLNISITLFWTGIFIVTFFILKTSLHVFKILCVACLLVFYYSIYAWATNDWDLLPTLQKVNFINSTVLILGLEYFTGKEDFAHIKLRGHKDVIDEPAV